METLDLAHGSVDLPAFFPDGTYGAVRAADARDLQECLIPGMVMNTYHLMSRPGAKTIRRMGGMHAFSGWQGPILTDSGGFQVFSLIRENPAYGEIRNQGILFRPDLDQRKVIFTPEKCIQIQFACGSDIMMCLDYCTHPDDSEATTRHSVEMTIRWARACKDEYERLLAQRRKTGGSEIKRPLLFAIIQGGSSREMRRYCAEALIEIGFDGFGFGGWPLDGSGNLLNDILAYTASLMPAGKVRYAMGVGKPEEIVECVRMGYNLFDCVIPTREARHNRLYVFQPDENGHIDITSPGFYRYLYINDDKHLKNDEPISGSCDCHCCQNYSLAWLHHQFKTGDPSVLRLATIHNLRFYSRLMELIRQRGL